MIEILELMLENMGTFWFILTFWVLGALIGNAWNNRKNP
jgi:hypothetical protein